MPGGSDYPDGLGEIGLGDLDLSKIGLGDLDDLGDLGDLGLDLDDLGLGYPNPNTVLSPDPLFSSFGFPQGDNFFSMQPQADQITGLTKHKEGKWLYKIVSKFNGYDKYKVLRYFNRIKFKDNEINEVDADGKTLLHLAAFHKKFIFLINIIDKGFDTNIVDKEGKTAYHYVVEKSCLKSIKAILSKEEDKSVLSIADKHGRTILHYAALRGKGSIQILEYILSNITNDEAFFNAIDCEGKNAFHYIMTKIYIRHHSHLLENIFKNPVAQKALKTACYDGKTPIEILCLSKGDKYAFRIFNIIIKSYPQFFEVVDQNGKKPLDYLETRPIEKVKSGNAWFSDVINKIHSYRTVRINNSCIKPLKELIKEAKSKGKLNEVDNHGKTFLHWACLIKDGFFINQIIEDGVDVSIADKQGRTALHDYLSKQGSRKDVLRKIINAAKDGESFVAALDKCGRTVLHYFALNEKFTRIKSNLEGILEFNSSKAFIKIIDQEGNTALDYPGGKKMKIFIEEFNKDNSNKRLAEGDAEGKPEQKLRKLEEPSSVLDFINLESQFPVISSIGK